MMMMMNIISDCSSKTDVVLEVSLIFVGQGGNWFLSYLNRMVSSSVPRVYHSRAVPSITEKNEPSVRGRGRTELLLAVGFVASLL